jgi:hypothetical protein
MQPKIKKFIQNIPEETLQSFLNDYNLELPEDFTWQRNSVKYQKHLFNAIWGSNDNQKPTLFDIIERVHEMTDEVGQNNLHSLIGNDEKFLNLKSEYERSLWVLKNYPRKFQEAESQASFDYQRKSRQWSCYQSPKDKEIHFLDNEIAAFKNDALQHLNVSRKIQIETLCRVKKDHNGKELKIFQILASHDGLCKSLQTFNEENIITTFVCPVKEFLISYEAQSGRIEVVCNGKENRNQLAKIFADSFLKTKEEIDHLQIKKYELTRLYNYYDFMKDIDAKDLIENVKITLLKLSATEGKYSTTMEVGFNDNDSIYDAVRNYHGQNNPLLGPFIIKKARLSIKFKSNTKNPRGKLLHVTITNPNGCDLKERSENEKLIANKYLQKWGLLKQI